MRHVSNIRHVSCILCYVLCVMDNKYTKKAIRPGQSYTRGINHLMSFDPFDFLHAVLRHCFYNFLFIISTVIIWCSKNRPGWITHHWLRSMWVQCDLTLAGHQAGTTASFTLATDTVPGPSFITNITARKVFSFRNKTNAHYLPGCIVLTSVPLAGSNAEVTKASRCLNILKTDYLLSTLLYWKKYNRTGESLLYFTWLGLHLTEIALILI